MLIAQNSVIMKKLLYLALFIAAVSAGCIKKGDLSFKNIQVDNWQPDWALPIINSRLTLKNILPNNATISEDASGLYSLHYGSSLFYARASDFIVIPDQNYNMPATPLSIPQSIPSFSASITDSSSGHFTYTDTSGAQLAHIAVKMGSISIHVASTFRQNVSVTMLFPTITQNGVPLQLTTPIAYPTTNANLGAELAGYSIDLTNGNTTKNYIPYKIRFTVTGTGQPITSGDNVAATVAMAGLKYSFIDGFIGHFNIPVSGDTIQVGVFNNTLSANIYLRNPKINLTFKNSMGMGVFADFDHIFGLTNSGTRVDLTLPSIAVAGPTAPGQYLSSSYTLDSTNSSVQSMFNPAPNQVVYNGRIAVNPVTSTTYNFVTDSSFLTLSADAELPAWFKIIDFSVQDTLPLTLATDTSILQKAQFKLLMDNALPLYGRVQLYFVDAGYHIIDSLVSSGGDIISEAPVDAEGKVTGHTQKVSTFVLEHNKYNAMAPLVKYAFIRGNLKTSGINKDIKIFSADNLVVKLAFRFTLNASTTNL